MQRPQAREIRAVRVRAKVSLDELALALGVSQSQLSRYERGLVPALPEGKTDEDVTRIIAMITAERGGIAGAA